MHELSGGSWAGIRRERRTPRLLARVRMLTRLCLNGLRPRSQGMSPSAPCSGRAFEHAGARAAASIAAAISRQVPEGKIVPITPDEPCLAGMTICALPLFIVRVSGEHVPESRIPSDAACQAKRRRRRRRLVQHLPIGMKGGEVERNVRP